LDVNKLSKSSLLALAQSVCANESLETLSLRNIDANPKEIDEFLKNLIKAKSLQKLNLKFNNLNAAYFSTALKRLAFRVVF